jgi:DNA polymerase theta
MMGDTDRGYLLELMVTKLLYAKADEGWQIVGMSATIPNTIDLQRWLSTPTRTHSVLLRAWLTCLCLLVPTDAAMYVTDFRPVPLQEFIKIENKVYDTNFDLVRSLPPPTPDDADQVGALCSEVIASGHSALVFCPTRKGCEKSCEQMARLLRRKVSAPRPRRSRRFVQTNKPETPGTYHQRRAQKETSAGVGPARQDTSRHGSHARGISS